MSGVFPTTGLPAEYERGAYVGPVEPAHPLEGHPGRPLGGVPIPVLGQGMDGALMPQNATSSKLGNSLIVKVGQGWLLGVTARSGKAAAQFIQVFDTSSGVPANGAVPNVVVDVAASSTASIAYIPVLYPFAPGRLFYQGIVVVNSTTPDTLTIGAADTFFDVQYV